MLKRILHTSVSLILVLVCTLALPQTTHAAEITDVETLVGQLPEVSDPMGTEYYFYNQLTDIEKVIYWKISEATWENPVITINGVDGYSEEELNKSAQRAMVALMADDPTRHMYWLRTACGTVNGGVLTIQLEKFPIVSEYHVEKAMARAEQIVDTVGMEGDTYSRLRDLINLLHLQMDYNFDLLVRSDIIIQYDDSLYGCLLHNLAVCGGFSDTVKYLCDQLEIPCIVVHATDVDSTASAHAWNLVKMDDGQWYSVDASSDPEYSWDLEGFNPTGSGYVSSNHCLISLDGVFHDFMFPEQPENYYFYEGDYKVSYHDVQNKFKEPSGKFLYSVNSDGKTCTIIGYEGLQSGDLIIPETIDGYTVNAIGESAFARCDGFTGDLRIADSVVTIGEGAFYQCKGLSGELYLPQNLQIIEDYAFLKCERLSGNLKLPDSLKVLGFGAFIWCKSFSGDLYLPNVDVLEDNVFDYCYGFDGTIYLPDGLVWMPSIVGDTNFQNIHVNPTNPLYTSYDGVLFSKDMKTLIWFPTGKTGGYSVPDGVETIGKCAFETCTKMTGTLVLPKSLKTIEEYAFFQAGFTGELTIPVSVETIGNFAFCATKFSGDLIIPDSVISIGESAFSGAGFDGTLTLPKGINRIESAFGGSNFTGDLVIPDSVTHIEEYAFQGCPFGGSLILPEGLQEIGEGAFSAGNSDGAYFSNEIDLSNTNIQINQDAFAYRIFPDFNCNCGAEYELNSQFVMCTNCYGGYRHVHNWTDATCETPKTCTDCGAMEGETLAHDMGDWEITKAVTCTEDGFMRSDCSRCEYCEVRIIETTGHTFGDWTVINEPTCTEYGSKRRDCSRCEYGEVRIIEAAGHNYEYESVVTAPTCTEQGYTTHSCHCGDSYVDSYVDPLPLPEAEVAVARMILGNELAMQFAFPKDKIVEGVEYVVSVTKTYADGREDKNILVPQSEWKTSGSYYYVSFNGIAAKEMGDTINVQILTAEGVTVGDVFTDSVQNYAIRQLEKNPDDKTRALYVDMLNYGAAAQTYFKYDAENLVNVELKPEDMDYGTKEVKLENNLVKGPGYGASQLNLASSIQLRVKFNGIDSSMYAIVKFTNHMGREIEARVEGSEFMYSGTVVVIDDVVAADYDRDVTITVYNARGNIVASAVESVASYIARMSGGAEIYSAVAKYCAAAYGYLHK